MLLVSAGLIEPEPFMRAMTDGTAPALDGLAADLYHAFSAPYRGLPDEAFNGFRRFPLSIPCDSYDNGNGAAQALHHRLLLQWQKPVHFVWGCADQVFDEAWGREWAEAMHASFDAIANANHFLQNTHGNQVAKLILGSPRRTEAASSPSTRRAAMLHGGNLLIAIRGRRR